MDEEICTAAQTVAFHAQVASSPTSLADQRRTAYEFISRFQESASGKLQVDVGLSLLLSQKAGQITGEELQNAFTGLQLLRYATRFKWNQIEATHREYVKEKLCDFISNGTMMENWPFLLKETISSVLAEIAKKEWPQFWPNFIPYLMTLVRSTNQPVIFLVLKNLCEDLFTLQNVDNYERKKDLTQGMNCTAGDVFSLGFTILTEKGLEEKLWIQSARTVLKCLVAYADFAEQNHWIVEGRLIKLLGILSNSNLRSEAVDCLCQLFERQGSGRKDEKVAFVNICLCEEGRGFLTTALRSAVESSGADEETWTSKLDSLLVQLASNAKIECGGLVEYLELLSQIILSGNYRRGIITIAAVLGFLQRNQKLLRLPNHLAITDRIVRIIDLSVNLYFTQPQTLKILTESERARLKSEFSQLVRLFGQLEGKLYLIMSNNLRKMFQNLEISTLENLVTIVEYFTSSISSIERDVLTTGLEDLQLVTQGFTNENDLVLKSVILSAVSGTFAFLNLAQQSGTFSEGSLSLLNDIMSGMVQCYDKTDLEVGAKGLKKHVTSLFQKLASKFPNVLNLVANNLVQASLYVLPKLGTFEFCGLVDTLLILSNDWKDVEKQQALLKSISDLINWQQFATLSHPHVLRCKLKDQSEFENARATVIRGLSILQSFTCKLKARSVGNVLEHPASEVVRTFLHIVFQIIKSVHVFLDDLDLTKAFDLREVEKQQILCTDIAALEGNGGGRSHMDNIQVTTINIHEFCCTIIGESCKKFTSNIYTLSDISNVFIDYTCVNIEKLNNYRMRNLIRCLFTPFIVSCPVNLFDIAIRNFFQKLGMFMMKHLAQSWTPFVAYSQQQCSSEDNENALEESLEFAVLSLLTKDYFDLLYNALTSKSEQKSSFSNGERKEEIEDQDMEVGEKSPHSNRNEISLGELGNAVLQDESCFDSIVSISIHALRWSDSKVCDKALKILNVCWKRIQDFNNAQLLHNLLLQCLQASLVWLKNESNIDAIQKMVDKVIYIYVEKDGRIAEIMLGFGVSNEDLMKLYQLHNESKSDKKRKDLFLKWVKAKTTELNGSDLKTQWLKGMPSLTSLMKSEKNGQNSFAEQNEKPSKIPTDLKDFFMK